MTMMKMVSLMSIKKFKLFFFLLLFASIEVAADTEEFCDFSKVNYKNWNTNFSEKEKDSVVELDKKNSLGELSNPRDLYLLADAYLYGDYESIQQDINRGTDLLKKSSELGYVPSLNELAADLLDEGKFAEAKKLFCEAALKGYTHSQANIGLMYRDGTGVKKNDVLAFKWISYAAEKGSSFAMSLLAEIYSDEDSIHYNLSESKKMEIKAAENDFLFSQYILGENYLYGMNGFDVDFEKAEYWFKKNYDEFGYGPSANQLSNLYQMGEGKFFNERKAFYWAKQLNDDTSRLLDNKVLAKFKLAQMYKNGVGTVIDISKGVSLFKEVINIYDSSNDVEKEYAARSAAILGSTFAWGYHELGINLLEAKKWIKLSLELGIMDINHDDEDLEYLSLLIVSEDFEDALSFALKNPKKFAEQINFLNDKNSHSFNREVGILMVLYGQEKGIDYLEKAAKYDSNNNLDLSASNELSRVFLGLNRGLEAYDERLALYWLKKAAEVGVPEAMNNLGQMYAIGKIVDLNYDEALNWYYKAAENNFPRAYRNIGAILREQKKYKEAFEAFTKGAELEDVSSMIDLSLMYETGNDYITKNLNESFKWILKASRYPYENREAQYMLGEKYLLGIGVDIDEELAKYWISKSIDNNPNFQALKAHSLSDEDWYVESAKTVLGTLHDNKNNAYKFETGKEFYLDNDAENGGPEEKYKVGWEYYESKNYDKAIYWIKRSAEIGYLKAQITLGHFNSGQFIGFEKNYKQAEFWYSKAAIKNDVNAISYLGWLYTLANENPGIDSPIYDIEKAKKYLNLARKQNNPWAINTLIHIYQYELDKTINKEESIKIALSLLSELISLDDEEFTPEHQLIKAVSLQNTYEIYPDLELFNKGMAVLNKLSSEGDSKIQVKLGEAYLYEDSPHYSRDKAFYWLNKASKNTIAANIKLADLYFEAKDYNFYKHGSSLKKAINLFENQKAKDFDFYNTWYRDGIIVAYQSLANYYINIDAKEMAEITIRKSTSLYDYSESNRYELNKNIILATVGRNFSESKKILNEYLLMPNETLNPIESESIESYIYVFNSLIGLHSHLRNQKKYQESIELMSEMAEKFANSGPGGLYYKPIMELEIARDLISLSNFKSAKEHLRKYEEYQDDLNPNFIEKIGLYIAYGDLVDEGLKKIIDAKNPIERVLFKVLSGIIQIKEDKVEIGYKFINEALDDINNLGVPIRAVDLDFSIIPINLLMEKSHIKKSRLLMSKVVDLYKKNAELRVKEGIDMPISERKYIAKAINLYLDIIEKSGQEIENLGFKEMQLVSGLTLSETILESLRLKRYTGNEFAIRKILKGLYLDRNELVTQKYNNLSNKKSVAEIDSKLTDIDEEIQNYENSIYKNKSNLIDSYIADLDEIQKVLHNDDVILSSSIAENHSYVWLITKDGIYRDKSSLNTSEIKTISENLLSSLEPSSSAQFSVYDSSSLYDFLIAPFEKQLKGKDRIIFIPDSNLSNIPLSVLVTDITESNKVNIKSNELPNLRGFSSNQISNNNQHNLSFLIENYSITVIPSYYSFLELSKISKSSLQNFTSFLGVGNPILRGNNQNLSKGFIRSSGSIRGNLLNSIKKLAPLPETALELEEISKMFQKSELLLADKATEISIYNKDLTNFDVISFATHALVSNEIKNVYEPALVLTPVDELNKSNDGLLTASEVSKLDLDADIVVLSACNTASSINSSSGEGLTGLANSFFEAGAKSLFVSYWSVISDAAKEITTNIFSQKNNSRSFAHKHRESVIKLLNSSDLLKSNPKYWAPFSVIGVN